MSAAYNMDGEIGQGGCTARAFKAFAEQNPGAVTVYLNSYGGVAIEGAAILAEFERHGRVTVIGQGIVASAASLAMMGGAKIVMHRDALFMIHDPSAMIFGPATAHRDAAETLDKIGETYARAYARASGNSIPNIKAWMRDETWLSADEALSLNFCDRIEGNTDASPVAQFDFTRFQNAPDQLVNMARANGWATASPNAGKKDLAHA